MYEMIRWERKERLGHGAVTRLAKRLRVSPTRVSRVLNDHEVIPRIQRAIAQEIGLPVEVVFPPAQPADVSGATSTASAA